jgi:hypothetical protein
VRARSPVSASEVASASLTHATSVTPCASGGAQGPPPPFDVDDAMLAKRHEEKAAVRAALKQRAPLADRTYR